MKRLPKVLVAISVITVLIMALAIIGLRLFLPQIDEYRSQLEGRLQSLTGIPFKVGHIEGEWVSFGPVLTFSDVSVATEKANIKVKTVKFSLDIWRSLFSLHLHFRDIIFYQLNADCYKPLEFASEGDFSHFDLDALDELFLKQFDYFTLKESRITFLTPSAEKRTLKIPELTWLNQNEYHRAQGFVNLDNFEQQDQDAIQVKLNLRDKNGVINEGTVYLQADNVNLRPWLSRWLRDSTGLEDTVFSLSSWITIKDNRIEGGQLQLHQGQANWQVDGQEHQLAVDDLLLIMHRQENGWLFNIPQLQHLKTDQQQWLEGQISLLYLPQSKAHQNQDHWRIRVNNIQLERLRSILPTFSFFTPEFIGDWQKRQPKGQLIALALDITPDNPEKALIDMTWQDISWIRWKDLPSISHFSGSLRGSQQGGIFSFNLNDSHIEYTPMFKVPLEISAGQGTIFWSEEDKSRLIWSENLALQAKSLWTTGDFRYLAPKDQPPTLSILAGAKLTNAGDVWRYFPETLIGKDLTDYLTKAIIAGHVDEATVVFHGNPADFPFKKNNGQFQVVAPLRAATFKYQPDWPTIFDLDIDLNFERNGLWMSAPDVKLGDVKATDLSADIADYSQSKLSIKSHITGDGKAIRNYFVHSPMEGSIGKALDAVKIGGKVSGKLMLDIPLAGDGSVIASGRVDLNNNDVDITVIDSQIKQLTGRFYFRNGDLKSEKLQAQWFGQPIDLTFKTANKRQNYQINVNVGGNWQAKKIAILPKSITRYLAGSTAWQGQVNIQLPNKVRQKPILSIDLDSKLGQLTSQLPALNTQQVRQLSDIQIRASGDTSQLQIYGDVGQQLSFNSQWQFTNKQVRLLKGAIQPYTQKSVVLPDSQLFMLNLPEIDDPKWLSLLALLPSLNLGPQNYGKSFVMPDIAIVNLPKITFAEQQWNNMVFTISKTAQLTKIVAQSDMLKGSLNIPKQGNWQAKIDYLYYNPEISTKQQNFAETNNFALRYDISGWPNIDIYCSECWVAGYKLGELRAQIIRNRQTLILKEGSLINSVTNLKISGMWHADRQNSTAIRGTLKGNRFDDLTAYYGILVPIKQAPFKIDFDLNWAAIPWQPDVDSLNGNLSFNLAKGGIAQMGGGGAGQLLRFVSFDALLRKLQLDFSDTFSNDFAFDSIRGKANIKNGILNTDDFYIDGLMADITIHGKINLVRRDMNLEAIITPEISATVGVATAFAINPIAGAAVFAASRVLGPLWNKISVIRYRITGSLEQPKIDETLRQLKENQQNDK